MPWVLADVERHKAGLTAQQKRKWVAVANSALASCQAAGRENCEASAIRQANSESTKVLGDDMLIAYGGGIKALGDGRIGGLGIRFTSPDERDLTGEYFTPETYYGSHKGDGADCWVNHGFPLLPGEQAREWADHLLSPVKAEVQDLGIWAEAVCDMSDAYERKVYEMVEAGKLGWSSGTAGHMRRVTDDGEITRWPIVEFSLTPAPAEPRNRVMTLRAYKALSVEPLEVAEPEGGVTETAPAATATKSAEPKAKRQAKAKGGKAVNIKRFLIDKMYYAYGVDEEGKRTGEPLYAALKSEDVDKWIEDAKKSPTERALDSVVDKFTKTIDNMAKALAASQGAKDGGLYLAGGAQVKSPHTFGDFLQALYYDNRTALKAMGSEWTKWEQTQGGMKVLGDQSGGEGGFLVPTQFLPNLIRIDPEAEIVWPTGDVIPMSSRSVQVPGVATTGSTAGRTNVFGGAFVFWTETGTAKHETDINFTQIELVAYELSAWIPIKEALIADSAVSLEPLITGIFRDALMYYSDEAFLDGTGVGQPQGIISAPGTLVLARDTANRILYEDVKTMLMHFMRQAIGGAFWTINQFCMAEIMDMVDEAGNLIWQPNARESVPTRLLGLPIRWTEKTPALGIQGDIILMNPAWYYIGRRQGVSIAKSEHVRFLQNQVVFKCVMRLDGQEKLPAPVFAKDANNQYSPFVVLGAAVT